MNDRELFKIAKEASLHAYVPYSGFPVGAALECEDGTVFTGEEAVTRYENQMREMSQMLRAQSGEYELTVYTAGGQLVALTMVSRTTEAEKAATAVLEKMKAFTKKDSETPAADESAVMTQGEPDSQNLTYYRKTLAGEVSHLIDWKITQDNETLRVSGEYRDAGDKVQAEVVLSSDGDEISLLYGRDAMGFVAAAAKKSTSETYALVFDHEETDADLYWSLKVLGGNHLFEADRFSWNTVCEAENPQETEYLALVCDVQGFGMGNIAQEKLSLDLSLMGESLATLHVDRKATQEEALPTMVDLSKMTDEEMGQWGVETLSQGVSGLVGITQKLPDSVMNALFGF